MKYLILFNLTIIFLNASGQPKEDYISLDPNYYQFSEKSTISLGRGFLPNLQDVVKQSPFRYDLDTIEGKGSYLTSFEIQLVTDKRTLEEALDWDVKLDVKSRMVTAETSLKIIENTTFNDDELTFLIKAETEYGRTSIKNLKLTKEAKRLYKKSSKKFIQQFGSKIPVTKRHGASVYIIVTIQNISQTRKKTINASFMLKRSSLSFSGTLTTHLNKAVFQANERKDLKVSILTKGGSGLDNFSGILANLNQENFIKTIQTGIADYFKQFNFSNSAPLGYFCASYKDLGLPNVPEYDLTKVQLLYLKNIVEKHRQAYSLLRTYQKILDNRDLLSNFLTPARRIELNKLTVEISRYLDSLDKLHSKYLRAEPASGTVIPNLPNTALNYFRDFNIEIKGLWELHNPRMLLDVDQEPVDLRLDYIRDDDFCQYNTYISGPYLSYIRILGIPYDETGDNEGKVRNIRTLISPHEEDLGVITPYIIDIDKDKKGIKCDYFKSANFLTALQAAFGDRGNEKIDIMVEAENTVGMKSRKVLMTIHKGALRSPATVVYK